MALIIAKIRKLANVPQVSLCLCKVRIPLFPIVERLSMLDVIENFLHEERYAVYVHINLQNKSAPALFRFAHARKNKTALSSQARYLNFGFHMLLLCEWRRKKCTTYTKSTILKNTLRRF